MPVRSKSGGRVWVKRHDTLVTTGRKPTEAVDEQAAQGIFSVIVSLGILALIFLVVDTFVSTPAEAGRRFDPGLSFSALLVLFTLLITLLYRLTKLGRFSASRFVKLGWVFEILFCLFVSFGELNRPRFPGMPLDGISFVTVVIVLFPMFVPTTLKKAFLVSVAAASTGPLALILYGWIRGGGFPEPRLFTHYVASFVVIWIVLRTAKQLQIMGRKVEEARRMGSYELIELLGKGGMGEVWRGSHTHLRRPAALKLIRPEALGAEGGDPTKTLQRFEREAQATAELHSPHTIRLYDFGRTESGSFFYVMELLNGIDLESLVERFGPQPAERVVRFLLQACDSLDDAHRSGLIHRDIKPANLYVCRYGHRVDYVKVLDFGLVKGSGGVEEMKTRLTGEGMIAGTPAYVAPEAARDGIADARADIYSLGCVAYWLLTGVLTFERDTPMQTVIAHLQDPPLRPSERTEMEIPEALERIVMACLEKDPERRPSSAEALRQALEKCDLAAVWTEERAIRWWETHLPVKTDTVSSPI